ncbi:hypothetical protein M0R19_04315 [Candidatus Pacearchaeota archaeon]|jgi:hypothetical protein|nr:hypothetical protein [Candidatus Pacearchaeota archaeon]
MEEENKTPENSPESSDFETDNPGKVDSFLQRIMSRKLIVWLTATAALFMGTLDPDTWSNISMVYIGSVALLDLFYKFKELKQ